MMIERQPPSDGELEVLKTLWDLGPAPVRGVGEALRGRGIERAYTTIQTLLTRLQAKGHVVSEAQGERWCTGRLRPAPTWSATGSATWPTSFARGSRPRWSSAWLKATGFRPPRSPGSGPCSTGIAARNRGGATEQPDKIEGGATCWVGSRRQR